MITRMLCARLTMAMFVVGLVLNTVAAAQEQKPPAKKEPTIVFTVKGMCCAREAAPCVKGLEKVKGVAKVTADTKKGTLTIEPKSKAEPSPKELWQAVENAKVTPVKLAMGGEKFTKKPKK